jgi:AbiV family abortive infection protein
MHSPTKPLQTSMMTQESKMSVTPQYLLQGAWYALEQCGLLLRDANILCRSGSYASAIALVGFAREELGRFRILLGLWRKAFAGEAVTIDQIRIVSEDHVMRQRAGMLSGVLTADNESELGKLLRIRMESNPQSPEWKKADVELKKLGERKAKRTPSDRHEQRMAALYVDPLPESQNWNRPATTFSAVDARNFLQEAVNDYAGQYDRYAASIELILKDADPDLYGALEQWPDRPELKPPEWPPPA